MKVGLKNKSASGAQEFGFEAHIERIEKTASATDPKRNTLTVFFTGLEGMGFFDLSPNEIDQLIEHLGLKKKLPHPKPAKKKHLKKKKKS